MTCCLNKNIYSRSKNWVSLINSVEMRQKRKVCPYYANLYAYGANKPVRYVDPDGRDVFMAGITVTVSYGTGLTVETGLIMSIDKNGNYQIGTYQISGGGFSPSLGASGTGSISCEGQSFKEAWKNAVDNGLLSNIGPNILEHFKEAYTQQYNQQLPVEE